MPTLDLGVLVSGTGTNLQAVIDAVSAGLLDARVRLVLSNKPGVPALERAHRAGVPTRVLSHKGYSRREDYDHVLVETLQQAGARWIVLAGFMRILTPVFLDAFPMRVINIHPALLPSFPGVDAQGQALAYGVRVTGCTVHFVDSGTDTGPIIAQAAVPVMPDDTRDSLAHRILAREHEALPTVLQWIAEDRVVVEPCSDGGRARVLVRGRNPFLGFRPENR